MSYNISLGKYHYEGGYGANWTSIENGVDIGDVRMIDKVFHYAWMIQRRFFKKDIVHWSRCDGKFGLSEVAK